QGSGERVPPSRPRDRIDRGRTCGRAATDLRGRGRAAPRPAPGGEAGGGGGAVSHPAGRAALAGGLAERGPTGDPLRPRDPARPVAARVPRPECAGPGPRAGPPGQLPNRPARAPPLPLIVALCPLLAGGAGLAR